MLLILDNCEHLIEPAADLAHAIIQGGAVPFSRRPPGAARFPAKVYPILPLPLPLGATVYSAAALAGGAPVRRSRSRKAVVRLTEREGARGHLRW